MTKYGRDLDAHSQVEADLDDTTGDVTLFYGIGRACDLDAGQALELLSFLRTHEDDIKRGQKKAQEVEHAESFWYTNTFKPSNECDCPVCRYIRCDDGDEAFAQNFPDVSHGAFGHRMVELDLHYSC